MTKTELARSIEQAVGSHFINISQMAAYMGTGRDYVRANIVNGLDYISTGKNKMYFVGDVAERIIKLKDTAS